VEGRKQIKSEKCSQMKILKRRRRGGIVFHTVPHVRWQTKNSLESGWMV